MKRDKYYYNPKSLQYEKIDKGFRYYAWRVGGFISAALVFALVITALAFTFFESPKEKILQRELNEMQDHLASMDQSIDLMSSILGELEDRDNNIYRVIFEAEPISNDIRRMGVGGVERYKIFDHLSNKEVLKTTKEKLDLLERKLYVQTKSYDEITRLIKNKEELLSAIPAILPIKDEYNIWFASGYGYRIDPIYKTKKFHKGVDFSGPIGAEIYATADGVITYAGYKRDGYGRKVKIDHGYNYKTLYAHLSKYVVRRGQKVKRGQLIGYLGNTGKSTAPHLHYEIIKNDRTVNPINYFYSDLTLDEYDELVKIANNTNQSFD